MKEFYISSTKYSLQERNTKRGRVYDVVFRIITLDGEEKQKKLSGYQTKALAKTAYTDFVTSKCELRKNNPIKKKNANKRNLLVGDLIREYLIISKSQIKESTIYDRTCAFKQHILPYFENTPIESITKTQLALWIEKLWASINPKNNKHYSYGQLEKIYNCFSIFFSWYSFKYERFNPFTQIKKPKRGKTQKLMEFWTRDEFNQFISVVDNPLFHCIFTLLFYTGRRKGEILALTPQDINKSTIRFNKSITRKTLDGTPYKVTSTKENKAQVIPICQIVQKELKSYNGNSPFFFGGERPIHDNMLQRAFEKYIEKSNVKKIRIHDLRHSFVSMMIHLGTNYTIIADLISDRPEQVIETYGHMYDEDRNLALSKIN